MTGRACTDSRYRCALRALYLGKNPPALPGPVEEHLALCASCRALAQTLSAADRTLGAACGAPVDVSAFERELGWHDLATRLRIRPVATRPALRPVAVQAAAALAAVVLVVWVVLGLPGTPLREKATGPAARGAAPAPWVEMLCIGEGGRVRPAGKPDGSLACRVDETLGFGYVNPAGAFQGLSMFAVGPRGGIHWYLPDPAEPGGLAIGPAARPEPVPRTVRLSVNHRPGKYTLAIVFSDRPLRLQELEPLAKNLASGEHRPRGWVIVTRTFRVEESAP